MLELRLSPDNGLCHLVDPGSVRRLIKEKLRQLGPLKTHFLSDSFHPGEEHPANLPQFGPLILTEVGNKVQVAPDIRPVFACLPESDLNGRQNDADEDES